jgi:hypothetical protein
LGDAGVEFLSIGMAGAEENCGAVDVVCEAGQVILRLHCNYRAVFSDLKSVFAREKKDLNT